MARYFLHLRDHVDELLDEDGVEYIDLEALKKGGVVASRDLMCGDMRNGIVDLRYRIDAENERGVIVYSLPFAAAVCIIPPQVPDQ